MTAGKTAREVLANRLEAEGDLAGARAAYDEALALDSGSQTLAEGRARIAIALGEADTAQHCARALAFHHDYPDRQVQMMLVAAAILGEAAIPFFDDILRRYPGHVGAHEAVSELRAEWGWADRFTESYRDALQTDPSNKPLLLSYWTVLSRARRYAEVLASMSAHRSLFEGDRNFALMEVNVASHAGLVAEAAALIERLDSEPDALLARAQVRLQTGDVAEASNILERVTKLESGNQTAWSLTELAWRLLGDARHDWLIHQPGLFGTRSLSLDEKELRQIAEMLRTLHARRAPPIGQSVRGGTQTAGQLFMRAEPEIRRLTEALGAAIRDFAIDLPAYDPGHPLLRYRHDGLAFGPSWSVRLTGGGFHASHFHPNGILSSACYISIPDPGGDGDREGWLELGRPPAELKIDVPPLASIKPEAGRLVLFPSFLFHGTRPFGGGERLSVAFDLVAVPMS